MKLQRKLLAAAVSVLLAAAPPAVFADEEATTEAVYYTSSDGMYNYTLDEEGNARITDFTVEADYEGEVVIPSELDGHTVVYIGNGAFVGAVGVTSVTIPATVTEMGECVFMKCTALETFVVEEGNPYFAATEDGVLICDDGGYLFAYPAGRTDTVYTVPDTVDEIAHGCFSYALHLEEVILPEGLIAVDSWAFAYSALRSVTFPDTALVIDDYAFAYCTNLHEVDLGSNMAEIYNAAFASCTALEEITLPDTLTYVGQMAFLGTSLKSITIPSSVGTISYYAFGYDTNLNQIADFVIYGVTGSQAQVYCTEVDEENDYENYFTFVAVSEEQANGDAEVRPDASGNTEEAETDAQGNTVQAATDAPSHVAAEAVPGQGDILRYILMGGGCLIVILAAVLGVLVLRRRNAAGEEDSHKNAERQDEEE